MKKILLITLLIIGCETNNVNKNTKSIQKDQNSSTVESLFSRHNNSLIGKNGLVTTSHPLASQVGIRILQDGGNAFDAAVASAAALAVVNPFMAGIGGVGGYALIYNAKTKETHALDFIGTSPIAASSEIYQGDKLWDFAKKATTGYLAPLVPGIPAGWYAIHSRYGKLSWEEVLAPAIEYAENGFPLTPSVVRSMNSGEMSIVKRYDYGREIFNNNDKSFKPGEIWTQKDLAKTLKALAKKGIDDFYKGETAEKFANHFQNNGGLITVEDLADYNVIWSEPISTTYRNYQVKTHGPGSSGMTILQWLNILEGYDLEILKRNSAEYIHLVSEAVKLGFLDDDLYNTGQPKSNFPLEKLISKEYASSQRARIDNNKAKFYNPVRTESISTLGEHTSHHTVIDKDHNIVTITQTLMYASGVVVPGTGVFFNNGMCYFNLEPGHTDELKGGRRPRFVMSPTILFRGDKPYLALGAAGGWTIPQTILQTILNVVDFRMGISEAASGPRFIHRYLRNSIPYVPGTDISIDKGISDETKKQLKTLGHRIIESNRNGKTLNAILIDPNTGVLWGPGSAVTY
jgi:gamma-glutamyltranspeptidase/glutathione hydrolase